jgi:hypothetical protein
MQQKKIFDDISNLPPEAHQQVTDFIAFLRTRYKRSDAKNQTKRINLINEPFIGMWKDREDMKNSGKWLRHVRKAEWGATS